MNAQATIKALFFVAVVAVVAVVAGCLDGRRPEPDPAIWFVTPAPGGEWQGDSLAVELDHAGIDWGPDAMHYHMYVDGGTFEGRPDVPTYDSFEAVLWYRNSLVGLGEHELTAVVHDAQCRAIQGLEARVMGVR